MTCPAVSFDGQLRCLHGGSHDQTPYHVDNHDGDTVLWREILLPAELRGPTGGAWIVYDWDRNAYPISLHLTELEARRKSDELGYGRVKFWA